MQREDENRLKRHYTLCYHDVYHVRVREYHFKTHLKTRLKYPAYN